MIFAWCERVGNIAVVEVSVMKVTAEELEEKTYSIAIVGTHSYEVCDVSKSHITILSQEDQETT